MSKWCDIIDRMITHKLQIKNEALQTTLDFILSERGLVCVRVGDCNWLLCKNNVSRALIQYLYRSLTR